MSLVNMRTQLNDADRGRYAVPSFNCSSLELARAIIETAEETDSPVIVQVHPSELRYAGVRPLGAMLRTMAEDAHVPIVIHLDHGDNMDTVKAAVENSFTSVMFDGAHLPLEENIQESRRVVDFCHKHDVSVEAELGVLGGIGAEVEHEGIVGELTDPAAAEEFVQKTEVDTLAIAVGNAHGLYKGADARSIDVERIREIFERVQVPLVLHGGSDTPDETIQRAIKYGIRKINISTDMKFAFRKAIFEFMSTSEDYELHHINAKGIAAAKIIIRDKLNLFGSLGACRNGS